jgi:hypothetical protein
MPGLTLFGCKKKYIIFTKIKKLVKIGAGEGIQTLDRQIRNLRSSEDRSLQLLFPFPWL